MARMDELKTRAKIASTWKGRREKKRLGVYEFAQKHGFQRNQIVDWDLGSHIPTPALIRRMEKALKKEGV